MPKIYLDTGQKTERIKYDSIDVSGKFIQVYDDLGNVLYGIRSACSLHLMHWISNKMGAYNQIILNKNNRSEFIADSISREGKRYSDSTVKSAISNLILNELIVSMSEKGKRGSTYFVNPYYFWKTGSQKDRAESIKGFIYKLNEYEGN